MTSRRSFRRLALLVAVPGLVASCGGAERAGEDTAGSDVPAAMSEAPASAPSPGLHGQAPPASAGIPAIVTLTPRSGTAEGSGAPSTDHPAAPARGADAVVDQFGLAFSPRVLVAEAGSAVRFTNSEGAITHNVHIRSVEGDSTVFNGDTGPTEGIDVDLPGAGGYDVLCDMHPGMTGFVFLTEAPYAVAAGNDGSFRLGSVPAGDYIVRAWTLDGGWQAEEVVTVGSGPTSLDLTTR